MTETYLARLYEHMWWADDEVARALSSFTAASEDSVHLYAHILGAELIWLDRIQGEHQSVPVWPDENLEGCLQLASLSRERYGRFLSGLDDAGLCVSIRYRNSAGQSFETGLEDILLHVVLHGSYHRGQISSGIRESGGQPNPTDYIGFIRGMPAATRSDSRSSD